MMRHLAAATVLALMLSPLAARAGQKTVALNVADAGCTSCAPIVKAVLSKLGGVKAVEVKEAGFFGSVAVATVTFDDTVTNVDNLVAATTNAGYPSHPIETAAAK